MANVSRKANKTDKTLMGRFFERIGIHREPKIVVEHIPVEKLAIKNTTKLAGEHKPSPAARAYKMKRSRLNKIAAHSRRMNRIRFA
jgi:hypothetical protein